MIAPEMIDICVESFDLNFFKVDTEGYIIWANDNMLKASNIEDFSSIKGKHVEIFGHEVWESVKKVVDTGEKEIIEEHVNNKYYRTEKRPIFKNSRLTEVIGFSIDITKEKKAEITKEAFLENARHDIRTPFSGIVGFAHLVHSTNDINKIKEYTKDLVLSTEEFLEYHNKLLEAIKVADTLSGIFHKKKINLMEEMASVIDINKLIAMTKGIALDLIYDKEILTYPYFISDPIQVHRIALELVTNALKFTEKGSVVLQVKLQKKGSKESIIKISVSDTGIGIPKNKQDEIFLRFSRLSPSYKGIYKGAGLGLSIVKQFVDNLSGEIFVESEEGKGSTIGCYIPFQNPLIVSSKQK